MPEPVRLIRLGEIPYLETQSIYHALAARMSAGSPDTIILCRPATPYICIGYHQSCSAVLDVEECARLGLPVLRRKVGGGATYLDSHQLFYQCIFHQDRMPPVSKAIFAQLLAAPVATLRRLGLNATLQETNEIVVDGKRIAGTGGGSIGQASVVVGNLLFDFNYAAMARAWSSPSESFRALALDAMHAHITCLHQLASSVSMRTVESVLIEEYNRTLERPLYRDRLSPDEVESARAQAQHLSDPDYVRLHDGDGRTPPPLKIASGVTMHRYTVQTADCTLHANMCVSGGLIERVCLESNPLRDWDTLAVRLQGKSLDQAQALLNTLSSAPLA